MLMSEEKTVCEVGHKQTRNPKSDYIQVSNLPFGYPLLNSVSLVSLSLFLSNFACLFVCLSLCLSVCLSVLASVYLSQLSPPLSFLTT